MVQHRESKIRDWHAGMDEDPKSILALELIESGARWIG